MCKYTFNNFNWIGRVDSLFDKSSFRWHQVIDQINIDEISSLSKNSVILIGFCSDEGVRRNKGRQGSKKAPKIIRKYLASLPWHFDNLKLYDAGDVIVDTNLEEGQKLLSEKIKKIKELDAFPLIIGGGHETAFGSYLGIENYKPSIINFDAHFDNRPYDEKTSSGTMFAQIADRLKENYKYLCLGIQKSGNTKLLFERNEKFKGKFVLAKDLNNSLDIVQNYIENSKSIYLTLCSDVFASNIAPGVSAPTPFGINIDIFLKYLEEIIKSKKLCLFDITEVNPDVDINDMTSRLAANIIFNVIDLINTWGYK